MEMENDQEQMRKHIIYSGNIIIFIILMDAL